MAERRGNGRGRVLRTATAFTLGAALGSVVALLYAPASGKVTRRRLALRVNTLKRTAARRIGQTGRILADKAEDVRDAARGWIVDHMPHGNGRHPRRVIRHAAAR
jgi:hypothetical protein